ncbi:hypothetical protein BD408DRAFT_421891, partial [Parasitella parasitica]
MKRGVCFTYMSFLSIFECSHLFLCTTADHQAKDCTKSESVCYNCQETGHLSKDCSEPRAAKTCYKCQKTGHISR